MIQCQFQLITGETTANKFLNKMLPVNYGLQGLFLVCVLLPSAHFLLPVIGVLILLLLGSVALIELTKVKLFQTEGVIKLSEEFITLNSLTIKVIDLQQIRVRFNSPRGVGVGRNGIDDNGNSISIYTRASTEAIVATVLIEARAQRDNFVRVLMQWRKGGIEVYADGIDLV